MTLEPTSAPRLRTGFTTGACAAAAARAAARLAASGSPPTEVTITLPNGRPATFTVSGAERAGRAARCVVVKDGGDDQDVTHGAEIAAEVELVDSPGVALRGGTGVATVTRPGLAADVGGPAINPVPRRNVTEMVWAELTAWRRAGARVTISVPRGAELARGTMNARLGLVGGISILGTSGIVRPFSTAAWQASVAAAVDVAVAAGRRALVFTTGGRSEAFAMRLRPGLPADSFVQVGDAMGAALRHAARRGVEAVEVVAMVGKMSKLAAGALSIHASDSAVDLSFLARVSADAGGRELAATVAGANTAREALGLWRAAGVERRVADALCRAAAERCGAATPGVVLRTALIGFDGELLGQHPRGRR